MSTKKDDDANQTGQEVAGARNVPATSPTRRKRKKSRKSNPSSPAENPRTGKTRPSLHGIKYKKRDGALSPEGSVTQGRRRHKSSWRKPSKAAGIAEHKQRSEAAPVEEFSEVALARHDEDADVIAERDQQRAPSSAKFSPNVNDDGPTPVRSSIADTTAKLSPISSDLGISRASTTGVRSPGPLLAPSNLFAVDGQGKTISPTTSSVMPPLIPVDILEKAVVEEMPSRRQRIHPSRQVSDACRSNHVESEYDEGHREKKPMDVQRGMSIELSDVPGLVEAEHVQSAATSPRKSLHHVELKEDAHLTDLPITPSVERVRPQGTSQKETPLPRPPCSEDARDGSKYSFAHPGIHQEKTQVKERDTADHAAEGYGFHPLNKMREADRAHRSPLVTDEQQPRGGEARQEVAEGPVMDLSPQANQGLARDQSASTRVAPTALTADVARAKEKDRPEKLDGRIQSKRRVSDNKVRDPTTLRDRQGAAGKKKDLSSPRITRARTRSHGKRRAEPGALLSRDGRSRGNVDVSKNFSGSLKSK